MSQTLKVANFSDVNIVDETRLTGPIVPGAIDLPVENSWNNFSGGAFVLIGVAGSKVGEINQAGVIESASDIPLASPTILNHNQFDPVYSLFADKIRIYRAADAGQGAQPADAAFNYGTPYDTIAIDPSDANTGYTDVTGGPQWWYKATYYNSSSGAESDIASSVAVRGNFTVDYCSLDEIRREAGFKFAPYITDDQIDEKRQAAQDEINGALDVFYQTPLQPPIPSNLKNICIVLAAGYLRAAQYSQISDPGVNGQNKIDWAQIELDKLILKERVLVNKQGVALDQPGAAGGVEGWPNATTANTRGSQGGSARVFRISDTQPQAVDDSGRPVGNPYYGRRW